MKVLPILFNADMVRAILDGQKTQTRRPIPVLPKENQSVHHVAKDKYCFATDHANGYVSGVSEYFRKPYEVGDYLWVRETYRPIFGQTSELISVDYKADPPEKLERLGDVVGTPVKWRPSIHMPRSASRITLEITNVRVERLQDITEEDAIAEGCDYSRSEAAISVGWYERPRRAFRRTWEQIYGKESWDSNPLVWVIDFEVV